MNKRCERCDYGICESDTCPACGRCDCGAVASEHPNGCADIYGRPFEWPLRIWAEAVTNNPNMR